MTASTSLTDADRLIIAKARGHAALRGGAALRAHAETSDTTAALIITLGEAQYLLGELAAIAERLADAEYVRQHGDDDLETGHTRDPKGDEAAHA